MMNRTTRILWIGISLLGPMSTRCHAAPPTEGWVNSRLINGTIVRGGSMPLWHGTTATDRPPRNDGADMPRPASAASTARTHAPDTADQSGAAPPESAPAGRSPGTTAPALPLPTEASEARRAATGALTVAAGERLSSALVRFLRENGLQLQWSARSDYVARHAYSVAGTSIDETIEAALSPHGLSSTLWESNRVLEVHAHSARVRP